MNADYLRGWRWCVPMVVLEVVLGLVLALVVLQVMVLAVLVWVAVVVVVLIRGGGGGGGPLCTNVHSSTVTRSFLNKITRAIFSKNL